MASSSHRESQQIRLKRNLIEQFARGELRQISDRFMDGFVLDNPLVEKNAECIVDYLVDTQRNEDELLGEITRFLQIADEFSQNQINIELARDLFAYLLQTLVNASEVNARGMKQVSVSYIPTVKLIYAAEKGIAIVPDYDDLEYKAGKRNARFENIGDFQSRDAQWTVESVCEEIAEKLLGVLRETHRGNQGPLHTLSAKVIHAQHDSTKSPLHGIYIEAEYLKEHPFNNPQVVQYFMKMTKGRLPIYIYRVDQSVNGLQNLKIDEEDLMFFLKGDYKLLNRSLINESKEAEKKTDLPLNYIEKVENLHLYQNSYISLGQNAVDQLQQQIPQLNHEIEQAANITEHDRNEVIRAVRIVEQAMQNQGNIDKGQLKEANRIFELYRDTFGFAGSIASILLFFL